MPTCKSVRQSSSSPARQKSHVPQRRLTVATRSPTFRSLTLLPVATTTPEGSTPRTAGSVMLRLLPSRRTMRSSVRFTDTACTWTRTSSSPMDGMGTSSTSRTSGGPKRRMSTARIVVGSLIRVRDAETAVDEETAIAENPLDALRLLQTTNVAEWVGVDNEQVSPATCLQHASLRAEPKCVRGLARRHLERAHRSHVQQRHQELQLPRVATEWQDRARVRAHEHAHTRRGRVPR